MHQDNDVAPSVSKMSLLRLKTDQQAKQCKLKFILLPLMCLTPELCENAKPVLSQKISDIL